MRRQRRGLRRTLDRGQHSQELAISPTPWRRRRQNACSTRRRPSDGIVRGHVDLADCTSFGPADRAVNHDQGWSWQNCIRYMLMEQALQEVARRAHVVEQRRRPRRCPCAFGCAPKVRWRRSGFTLHEFLSQRSATRDPKANVFTWEMQDCASTSYSRESPRSAARRWTDGAPFPEDLRLAALVLPTRHGRNSGSRNAIPSTTR